MNYGCAGDRESDSEGSDVIREDREVRAGTVRSCRDETTNRLIGYRADVGHGKRWDGGSEGFVDIVQNGAGSERGCLLLVVDLQRGQLGAAGDSSAAELTLICPLIPSILTSHPFVHDRSLGE